MGCTSNSNSTPSDHRPPHLMPLLRVSDGHSCFSTPRVHTVSPTWHVVWPLICVYPGRPSALQQHHHHPRSPPSRARAVTEWVGPAADNALLPLAPLCSGRSPCPLVRQGLRSLARPAGCELLCWSLTVCCCAFSPAFSLMVRLADVCCMKMWHSPTLNCRRSLAISCSICFVTRWHPLLAAGSLISRCTQVILWNTEGQEIMQKGVGLRVFGIR